MGSDSLGVPRVTSKRLGAPEFQAARLARSEFVSVIEVRLGSTTRKFECLFSLVANHRRVTAGFTVGFAGANIRGNDTPADNYQQH
jgi:hypothetical protein